MVSDRRGVDKRGVLFKYSSHRHWRLFVPRIDVNVSNSLTQQNKRYSSNACKFVRWASCARSSKPYPSNFPIPSCWPVEPQVDVIVVSLMTSRSIIAHHVWALHDPSARRLSCPVSAFLVRWASHYVQLRLQQSIQVHPLVCMMFTLVKDLSVIVHIPFAQKSLYRIHYQIPIAVLILRKYPVTG